MLLYKFSFPPDIHALSTLDTGRREIRERERGRERGREGGRERGKERGERGRKEDQISS